MVDRGRDEFGDIFGLFLPLVPKNSMVKRGKIPDALHVP